jgi:hypothetical protein
MSLTTAILLLSYQNYERAAMEFVLYEIRNAKRDATATLYRGIAIYYMGHIEYATDIFYMAYSISDSLAVSEDCEKWIQRCHRIVHRDCKYLRSDHFKVDRVCENKRLVEFKKRLHQKKIVNART